MERGCNLYKFYLIIYNILYKSIKYWIIKNIRENDFHYIFFKKNIIVYSYIIR